MSSLTLLSSFLFVLWMLQFLSTLVAGRLPSSARLIISLHSGAGVLMLCTSFLTSALSVHVWRYNSSLSGYSLTWMDRWRWSQRWALRDPACYFWFNLERQFRNVLSTLCQLAQFQWLYEVLIQYQPEVPSDSSIFCEGEYQRPGSPRKHNPPTHLCRLSQDVVLEVQEICYALSSPWTRIVCVCVCVISILYFFSCLTDKGGGSKTSHTFFSWVDSVLAWVGDLIISSFISCHWFVWYQTLTTQDQTALTYV